MGWASASQLLNYKHSFDCKLNGKGCQLSLSSRGHTTRAPAVKNWHSCSERHHMLLLWAEQDLTLALLTLFLSQRGDGRDKSLDSECEFTQRRVPALIHPILLPLKEVKIYLGRWLSVLSFWEQSLTWARVYHIDFEVHYEIINAFSRKAPQCDQFSSFTGLPGLQPECQNKTTLVSHLSRDGLEQHHPSCPGHTGAIKTPVSARRIWAGRKKLSGAVNWAVQYKRQLLGQERFLCWDMCPDMECGSWARLQLLLARACQPWGSRRARESPSSAVSINSSLPGQVKVITEPAQMLIHSVI